MKRININNGMGEDCTIKEALAEFSIDTLAHYMDDETREAVCRECDCESDEEFVEEYLKHAPYDLIIG